MNIVITDPFEVRPIMRTEEGVLDYFSRISELSHSDLCIELSNVLVAKDNRMMIPVGVGWDDISENQQAVTDLTDRAFVICIFEFGREVVFSYSNGDLRSFNGLVNEVDEEAAQQNLSPEEHGDRVLKSLRDKLGMEGMSALAIEISKGVHARIGSDSVAKQFILEELQAASSGDDVAKEFVKQSGISANEYAGAMSNSFEEVDGANGPQQFLLRSCMSLGDMDLTVATRLQVVDHVMKSWKLGKYRSTDPRKRSLS